MFTSILILAALMAEAGHVFVIRQEQIRSEKGTRTLFYATIIVCLLCVGQISLTTASSQIENSEILYSPIIQTNAVFAQLNTSFTIKCTCIGKNEKPLVKWYLPTDESGFLHYVTEDDINNGTKTTQILLLLVYKNQNLTSLLDKPILVSNSHLWDFGVGGSAVFNCKFDAKPIGEMQWYRNDHKLVPDAIRIIINQANVMDIQMSILTISGIVYKDYGLYTCLCENQFGYAKKQFQIQNDYGRLTDKCLDHVDCFVPYSFCNYQTKMCQCQIGYQQSLNTTASKCIKIARLNEGCTSNQDCVNKFAHCNLVCECDSNFIAIRTNSSYTCYPRYDAFGLSFQKRTEQVAFQIQIQSSSLITEPHKHKKQRDFREDYSYHIKPQVPAKASAPLSPNIYLREQ
uniref:Ig-like domain-containing protein n=1 Tax=Strigamia maritima TaxID=126957 RepID=T1II43_STRMM